MTNYPKDEESSFKNEKIMSISFFEEILEFTRIRQVYKGKVGRGNFKTLQFGTRCINLTQKFFLKLRNYKVGKVKNIRTIVAIKKNAQSRMA